MTTGVIDLRVGPNQIVNLKLEPTSPVNLVVSASIGERGQTGPPGPSGGNHIHTQANASTVWLIQHNFGYRPAGFLFYDDLGNPIGAIVTHLNDNVAVATFLRPYSGKVYVS